MVSPQMYMGVPSFREKMEARSSVDALRSMKDSISARIKEPKYRKIRARVQRATSTLK